MAQTMSLTNFEKWRSYMSGITSPDCYINWGWHYLIAASLQRRVWMGPNHERLFPNMYVILVGEPAVGKGRVTRPINEILRYHKLENPSSEKPTPKSDMSKEDKATIDALIEANFADGTKGEEKKNKRIFEKPLLIPVGASATTWEALVNALANSLRRINYSEYDERIQKNVIKIYTHSSLCFCLEEISSMFRKKTEEVARFLLQTYDCGDYEYDTKTPGLKDYVKKCCLNLLGGTTPGFMQELFNDRLLTEGFASRCFFIFAARNRFDKMFGTDLTDEQKQHYEDILLHVKKLTSLYGRVQFSEESKAFLEEWWKESQQTRPNTSYKLNYYYGRKNIHVQKLAMALHFGESTELFIKHETFLRALEILAVEEKKMHLALGIDSNNPLNLPAQKIHKYLVHYSQAFTAKELLVEFWGILPGRPSARENLETVLEHLYISGKITRREGDHPVTGKREYFYSTIKETGEDININNKMPGEL